MPSKRLHTTGRKLKNISDPKLAHSHAAGAKVYFAQPAIDKKWGRFYFYHYPRNYHLFVAGQKAYKRTFKLLEECRKLPVNPKTNDRTVPEKLRDLLEIASMSYFVLTKMGFEYLTAEYLLAVKQNKDHKHEPFTMPSDDDDLLEKVKSLVSGLGITQPIPQAVMTVLERRDIVEHPTQSRLYNCTETGWKNNHLAWVLSGEIEGLPDQIIPFVNTVVKAAEKYKEDNPVPGTLTGLTRGLKSGEPFKKPKI